MDIRKCYDDLYLTVVSHILGINIVFAMNLKKDLDCNKGVYASTSSTLTFAKYPQIGAC